MSVFCGKNPQPVVLALACVLSGLILCDAQMTAQDKADFLKEHNAYRAEVGSPPLQWDNDLQAIAQEWADHLKDEEGCDIVHRKTPQGNTCSEIILGLTGQRACLLGENLSWKLEFGGVEDRTGVEVTNAWTAEKGRWNFGSTFEAMNTNNCPQGGTIGHYTQVVWAGSTHIGCGKAFCGISGAWVCNYYPAGNDNKYPYCRANNPSYVGECGNFQYQSSLDPSGDQCQTPTTTCSTNGVGRCSTEDPCAISLTWPEIDALQNAGKKVFTGGLGAQMDDDHWAWLCWEDSGCAPNDLACFKYHENDKVFEWYGFNSLLRIVPESEYLP